jgi:cytochrome c oxidase subunit 2
MGFTESFNTTFAFVFWVSVVLMIAITFAMVYFMFRYHHTRNKKAEDIHGHFGLEVAWTVIPTILVMTMFYYGYVGYEKMSTIPEDAMPIDVTGRMWSWTFKYDNGIETDTLYVPQGKPIRLNLHSVDVIHSFYIPAFKAKKDAVPGVKTDMWFQADSAGVFDVFCAEYCGDRHSYMLTKVKVLPKAQFDSWYAKGGESVEQPAAAATDQPVDKRAQGEKLVRLKGCMACHSTDGSRLVGPSFKGIYGKDETVITNGKERTVTVDEDYIVRSIRQPDADKVKGFENMVMTQIQLSDDEIAAIVDYIKSLK